MGRNLSISHSKWYVVAYNCNQYLFSYNFLVDYACFICEDEGSPKGALRQECRCPRCPTLPLSIDKPSKLVQHIGTHILHDPAVKDSNNPCGFCLNVGNLCSIRIIKGKGRKGAFTVDPQQSRCPNAAKLSITSASKSTPSNPCTNVPLVCPLCRDSADPVWKYNFRSHILTVHPTADIGQYKELYELDPHERASMKELFKAKPRRSKTKTVSGIKISDAHSSRSALRYMSRQVTHTYFVPNIIVHITRTAVNSSDIENNPSGSTPPTPNAGLAADESFGPEPETPSSTRSSTPNLSDHATDNPEEMEKQNEIANDENLSGELPDECAEQELNDSNNLIHVPEFRSSDPASAAPINQHPAPLMPPSHATSTSVAMSPTDETMGEISAPSRRSKRAIKPRVQADKATMDDSDCANSDCDDPKRPGELIKCAGLGCQTKVCTHFVGTSFGF